MMRACAIFFLLVVPEAVYGQTDDREERPDVRSTPSPISMHLTLSSAFDSNVEQNDRDLDSRGLLGGLVFRGQKKGDGRFFRLEYGVGAQNYSNTKRFNSARSELSAIFFQRLGPKLTAGAIGGYSRKISTEDRELADRYSAWSQLEYRPIEWTRIGFYGAYRSTQVEEEEAGQERVRLFGTDAGFEIGDFSIAELGYRFEKSDSVDAGRRYDRLTWRAEYAVRATDGDTIGFRIERRHRRYPERFVRSESVRVPREDYRWRPSVSWVHRFKAGPRLEIAYEYQTRTSNDPRRDFQRHRIDFTVRVPLVKSLAKGRPGRGIPPPRLPEGAEVTDDSVLDQLRFLTERAAQLEREGRTFTEGSSWQQVVAAQGVPSRVSDRPHFFEERWFYGSSWVVLQHGRVVSWHDSGELKVSPPLESRPKDEPRSNSTMVPTWRAPAPSLVDLAGNRKGAETPRGEISGPPANESPPPTLSSAFQQSSEWEIVLENGKTLPGYVWKYENGLAHAVLFLPNDRTLLVTLPEALIDRKASRSIETIKPR